MRTHQKSKLIVHIIHSIQDGRGTTTWLKQMLPEAAKSNTKHMICILGRKKEPNQEFFERFGISTHYLGTSYKNPAMYIWRMSKLFLRYRPAAVHTHLGWIGALDMIVARITCIPCRIIYFHSGDWLHAGGILRSILASAAILAGRHFATHFTAGTMSAIRRWVPKRLIKPDTVAAIPTGIKLHEATEMDPRNIRSQLSLQERAWVVGSVGRLSPEKNHELLIRAIAELAPQYPHVHLMIVGDGPQRGTLQRLAESLNIPDKTLLVGHQDAIYGYLAAMDVFAFPSKFESFGIALLEAQNAGLPVVCTKLEVLLECLAPQWHHLCFEQNADATTVALQIENTIGSSRDRPSAFLERFSIRESAATLNHFYERIL